MLLCPISPLCLIPNQHFVYISIVLCFFFLFISAVSVYFLHLVFFLFFLTLCYLLDSNFVGFFMYVFFFLHFICYFVIWNVNNIQIIIFSIIAQEQVEEKRQCQQTTRLVQTLQMLLDFKEQQREVPV